MTAKPPLIATLFGMILTTAAYSQTVSPSLDGVWRQDDGSTTVRIAPCAGSVNLCATVIEERLPLPKGVTSSMNQVIVKDMKPSGKNSWKGKFIDAQGTLDATAKLSNPTSLAFRACVAVFLCQTNNFKRVSD
jgi:uncharacterized protein (DUF2147 family)